MTKARGGTLRSRLARTAFLAWSLLVLDIAVARQLGAQCAITGGPINYDPLPVGTRPEPGTMIPMVKSLALFQAGGTGAYYVTDAYNYGYLTFSLANPLSPSMIDWVDYHSMDGYQIPQDGQTSVGAVGASPDGANLLVGYIYGHPTLALLPNTRTPGTFTRESAYFPPFWDTTFGGGIRVDALTLPSGGKRHIAYSIQPGGLFVTDITTDPSTGRYTSERLPSELVAGAPGGTSVVGLELAVSKINGVEAERYIVYTTGYELSLGTSRIVMVNVTSPGAAGAGISSAFKVSIFKPEDFGLPANTQIARAVAAFHPTQPHMLEVLVEASQGLGSMGIAMKRFDTSRLTAVGKLNPPIDSRQYYVPSRDPNAPASNALYFAPNRSFVNQGPKLLTTPDDVIAFVWEQKSDYGLKLFTFSANNWGTDLSPGTAGVVPGTPLRTFGGANMTEGWYDGKDFYLAVGSYNFGNILKVTCQATSTPATPTIQVTDLNGASITSAPIGSQVKVTRNVTPAPVASTPTALATWFLDLDYHVAGGETNASYPFLIRPDVASGSVGTTGIAVAGVMGLLTDPGTSYPAAFTFTGPCDPKNGASTSDLTTCWTSVVTGDMTSLTKVGNSFAVADEGKPAGLTAFAFEAANANGANPFASASLSWTVPNVRISATAGTTYAAALPKNIKVLNGSSLTFYDASEGNRAASGYKWYFGTTPGGSGWTLNANCTGPSCSPGFTGGNGVYNYWITVPYANGYKSLDCPVFSLDNTYCSAPRGTITVSDVVLDIRGIPTTVSKSPTKPNLIPQNYSSHSDTITECPATAGGSPYEYAVCSVANSQCTSLDTDFKPLAFSAGTGGTGQIPVPTTIGSYGVRIRYKYVSSGACAASTSTQPAVYWPTGTTLANSTYESLAVTNQTFRVDVRLGTSTGTSVACTTFTSTNCPSVGQLLVAVAIDTTTQLDVADFTIDWLFDADATGVPGASPSGLTGSPSATFYYTQSGSHTVTLNGEAASLDLWVNPAATATPTGTPGSRCGTGTVALSASGALAGQDYKWYAAASGGTAQQTGGASYTTPSISTTTTYYASIYDTTTLREGSRTAVTATVNGIPSAPSISAPANTFSGAAGLVASVSLHAGATYAWGITNGTITSGGGTSQVTFGAGTAGTLTLTVVETSSAGCASGQASTPVTVSASDTPPDVTSFAASSVLVSPGGAARLAWETSRATNATLNSSPVPTSGSQVVTPSATTLYTLVATNTYGSTTRLATVNVNGGTAGLSSPSITTPTASQVVGVKAVTFTWGSVSGAAGYDLRVFDASSGLTVFSGSLTGPASTSSLIELRQGSFLFAVRACNASGFGDSQCGAYATRSFSINLFSPGGAPTVTAPAQGATLAVSTTAFGWTAVTPNPAIGGLKYEVLLTDLQHGTTALQTSVPDPTLSTIFTMKSSTSYELKVRACQAGCGPWSTPVTFAISLPSVPTGAPTITSANVVSRDLTVTWTTVPGADLYQVQVVQPSGGPGGGALTVAARQVSATSVTFPVPTGAATILVAGCTGDGCGPSSGDWPINPGGSNPTLPNFGTPMAGPMVNGPLVLFTWSRIPGDTGSNTTYRLYAMDFARQDTALDVLTTNNYYGAMFKAEGTQYGAVVIANPDSTGAGTSGPSVGFSVTGTSSWAPTMVAPRYGGTVRAGNVTLGWTPVEGATLYNYYVTSGSTVVQGVTPGLFVQAPLTATGSPWIGIIRACPAGATCVAGSDAGWSPWSNTSGGTGVASFTVVP